MHIFYFVISFFIL